MQNTSAKCKKKSRHRQEFIRNIRCAMGYHQDPQGFANLLGMSVSKLGRLERGEVHLKPADKSILAKVANIPEKDLEDFEPHPAKSKHQEGHKAPNHAQGTIYTLPEEVRQVIKEEIEHLRAENKRLHEHISKQDTMLRDCFAALTGPKK